MLVIFLVKMDNLFWNRISLHILCNVIVTIYVLYNVTVHPITKYIVKENHNCIMLIFYQNIEKKLKLRGLFGNSDCSMLFQLFPPVQDIHSCCTCIIQQNVLNLWIIFTLLHENWGSFCQKCTATQQWANATSKFNDGKKMSMSECSCVNMDTYSSDDGSDERK